MILIGVDEAGYGPNIGPLTIAGTLWTVEDDSVDLYEQLQQVIVQHHLPTENQIHIADSKKVHRRESLIFLEQPVLAILNATFGKLPQSWEDLINCVSPSGGRELFDQHGWLRDVEIPFPVAAKISDIRRLSDSFYKVCEGRNIKLVKAACRLMFADEFNQALSDSDNKASLLSLNSLHVVRSLIDSIDLPDRIQIGCDKHGGRNKYAALLQEYLTHEFVTVQKESLDESEYRFREDGREINIQFSAKGESFLPTALSSMIAKYVREVIMIGWNQFWQRHIPELKPTKGYPVDAKRFMREINGTREKLGIELASIWRTK